MTETNVYNREFGGGAARMGKEDRLFDKLVVREDNMPLRGWSIV